MAALHFSLFAVATVVVLAFCQAGKVDQLRKAIPNYDAGLPELSASNYSRYAVDGGRDFTLIALFTTRDSRFQCTTCEYVEKELIIAARSYAAAVPAHERDTFFAFVQYPQSPEAFGIHGFQTVPVLVKRPPSAKAAPRPVTIEPANLLDMPMQFSDDDDRKVPDADGILAFCGKPEIQASRDPAELYTIAITLSIVIGVIGAVAVHAPRLMFFPVTKQFWMFVSLAVYGVSVSGMIYCIIRTPPKVALDRNGEVSLFERREGQLVYEGLTVGGMNLLAAAGIILAYTTMKSGTKSNTKLVLLTVLGLVIFGVVYAKIVSIYQTKVGWYSVNNVLAKARWHVFRRVYNNLARETRQSWRIVTDALLKYLRQ